MTHPFHPLHGHEFELVETMAVMGVEWVHYTGDDETLRTIRQACVNGCVEPRIFGERDVVRMGGPIRAVVVSTQEIFFEDWR